ncbi:MBL fold metallo-hydrolase [Amycolatopsis orientalis]|uniref:MBL fold metallo-hydrolase n=1 Tax=Amycolatopsis orientalis TaxID=31958 RepID=UPI000566981D|nr:MBL fold metallo-hydrolase [Amycolatopsis orientalis]
MTALREGRVVRLGGSVPLDGRVSWAPADVRGTQPLNCYLVRSAEGAVLIDTGVRVHAARIVAQLRESVPENTPLAVVLTRTEMDCCLNLPEIEAAFPVTAVHYTGGITVPVVDAPRERITVEEGRPAELEPIPGIPLRIHAPRLRLLPTLWPYDPLSQTLFTSDSFCHTRTEADDAPDPAAVAAQLRVKFSWLDHADPAPVLDDLRAVFAADPVRAIAPGHGFPLLGRETVEAHVEATLKEIGR